MHLKIGVFLLLSFTFEANFYQHYNFVHNVRAIDNIQTLNSAPQMLSGIPLRNEWLDVPVQLYSKTSSFIGKHLSIAALHTLEFYPQTQKLESPCTA